MKADSTPTPAAPTNRLMSAVMIGRPMATTDPKAISSTMMATAMPMSSLLGSFFVEQSELPGELGLNAAGLGVARCGLRVVELGDGELVERVGDVDVGGLPVLAECRGLCGERVGDAGDVVAGRQLLTGSVDDGFVVGVVEPAVIDVEDDACGLAGAAGEPVVQDVGGSLRLDAGDTEAVVELAACSALQRHDGDRGDEPEADHPERVAGAAAAEAEKKCTHCESS